MAHTCRKDCRKTQLTLWICVQHNEFWCIYGDTDPYKKTTNPWLQIGDKHNEIVSAQNTKIHIKTTKSYFIAWSSFGYTKYHYEPLICMNRMMKIRSRNWIKNTWSEWKFTYSASWKENRSERFKPSNRMEATQPKDISPVIPSSSMSKYPRNWAPLLNAPKSCVHLSVIALWVIVLHFHFGYIQLRKLFEMDIVVLSGKVNSIDQKQFRFVAI